MADLLNAADLAYMRETQAEARPNAGWLQRTALGRGPGGDRVTVDLGEPVQVAARIWHEPDDIPQVLADRYEGGTLVKISLDMVLDVRAGDRLTSGGRSYELVSEGDPDTWSTAQPVWARRLDRPARSV